MKSAVFYGDEVIKIEEVPEPLTMPGYVKMKVAYCSICGSDVGRFYGPYVQGIPDSDGIQNEPIALGHEVSGIVSEIGEGVYTLKPGDRVVLQPFLYCGICENCMKGEYSLCKSHGIVGSACSGGMSEYIVVPERNLFRIEDDMPLLDAALVQLGGFAFGSVMGSGLGLGDTCMITGAGCTGLLSVQAARQSCAKTIIVTDKTPFRLEMAKKMGATHTINIQNENVKERVMEITKDCGVEYCYDTVGTEASVKEVMDAVCCNGTVIFVLNDYIFDEFIPVSRSILMKKQVNLKAFNSPYINAFPLLIEMARMGIMNIKPLVTKIISLNDVVEEGFHTITRDKNQIKIVIKVNDLNE